MSSRTPPPASSTPLPACLRGVALKSKAHFLPIEQADQPEEAQLGADGAWLAGPLQPAGAAPGRVSGGGVRPGAEGHLRGERVRVWGSGPGGAWRGSCAMSRVVGGGPQQAQRRGHHPPAQRRLCWPPPHRAVPAGLRGQRECCRQRRLVRPRGGWGQRRKGDRTAAPGAAPPPGHLRSRAGFAKGSAVIMPVTRLTTEPFVLKRPESLCGGTHAVDCEPQAAVCAAACERVSYIVVTYSRYHHSCCEGHVHGVRACSRHTTNTQFTGCFLVRSPPSLLRCGCGCGVLGAVCVFVRSVCPL